MPTNPTSFEDCDTGTAPEVAGPLFFRACMEQDVRVYVLYAASEEHPDVEVYGYPIKVTDDYVLIRPDWGEPFECRYTAILEAVEL